MEGIADLSAQAQLSLLRALREIESDPSPNVRLIAATDRDLPAATANGTFRRDLFDRLNRITIKGAPLRERKEDIPMLALYFLNRYAGRSGNKSPSLPRPAMDLLQSYLWPGNMREFQRVMERFVSFCITENSSVVTKCIPRESISACTSFRSVSNEKEFFDDALSEMLAELQG